MRQPAGSRASLQRRCAPLLFSVAWVCGLLSPVSCLMAAELKVAYVDVATIFDGYQRTKASDTNLKQKGDAKEAELKGKMTELEKLRQNLELLNSDAREAKTKEIEEKTEELQRFRTNTARDLGRERNKIADELLKEIQQAVHDYAKASGFSLVLDVRSVLFGQEAYDITDEVLATLNKRAAPPAH